MGGGPKTGGVLQTPSAQKPGRTGSKKETPASAKPSDLIPRKTLGVDAPREDAAHVLGLLRDDEFCLEVYRLEAQRIAAEHQAALKLPAQLVENIARLAERSAGARLELQGWAERNRALFQGKQSLELVEGAALCFRRGQRCVALREDFKLQTPNSRKAASTKEQKWSFGKALGLMLQNLRRWRGYIRRKPELDREKILAATAATDMATGKARKPKLTEERLAEVGLKVVQEENFSIEFSQPAANLKTDPSRSPASQL